LNDFSKVLRKKHAATASRHRRNELRSTLVLLNRISSLRLHFPPSLDPGILASPSGAFSGTALRLKLSTSVGDDSSLVRPTLETSVDSKFLIFRRSLSHSLICCSRMHALTFFSVRSNSLTIIWGI
jgi:hypothetical protein